MSENVSLAREIQATLAALRYELDDNGRVYKQTLKALGAAGADAVRRAGGYLPFREQLPSGFARTNDKTWAKSRTSRERAFPTYDRNAALGGLRVIKARARAIRGESGWKASRIDGISVEERDAAASIFDTAGRKGGNTDAGRRLIHGFDAASTFHSPLYRVLLPAVIDTKPEIEDAIRRALVEAQKHLDKAGR